MAYAYVKTVYAGTNVITLPFSYLSTNDVYLWVNDVIRPQSEITWTSSSIVTITTSGLTAGDVILIARVTNIASSNVVYSNDTQLTKDNLNNANKQLLYLNQETRDTTTLANATAATSMAAQVTAAASSATASANSATASAASATASANSATEASGYAESMADLIEAVTPANILAAIKTVDGTGSGLDADLLDGNDSSVFATAANLTSHTSATSAHSATSANTASRIVSRDSSGNFAAGTITANLTGTASAATLAANATKLATARNINVSGGVTGTAQSFDGTGDITIPTTITASDALTAIKTVDGAGSGLDADTLDGVELAGIVDYLSDAYQPIIHKGTCATAAATAAKTVTITGYTPTLGDLLAITFTLGSTVGSITLNINSLGAIEVRFVNAAVTTGNCTLAAGATLMLYYDGTYYQLLGSQDISDADTTDRVLISFGHPVDEALYDYKIVVMGTDGKLHPLTLETGQGTTKTVLTEAFYPDAFIGYYSSTTDVASGGTTSTSTVHQDMNIGTIGYTSNTLTYTAYLPVYLKCVPQADGTLKLDNTSYTSFMTQTLPTTEDGFVYIFLGYMYSTTGMRLYSNHPIYEYRGSGLRLWTGATPASLLADIKTVDGTGSGLDADTLDGVELSGIVDYLATSYAPLSHVSDTAAPHGAVSTNTASRIVTRDASGDFAAHIITANLTGTATSATYAAQLLTSKTFNVSGDVTGTAQSYNHTANVVIPCTLTKARAGTHAFRRLGLSAGGDNITITAANGTATCSFNLASYAIGSGSAAALFTAPVTGLYHFDVCLRFMTTTNAATGLACGLQTPTNLFYGTCPIPDGTLTGDLFSCSVSIDEYMTAATTASVTALKLGAGSCVVDMASSWWSGHLVYAA